MNARRLLVRGSFLGAALVLSLAAFLLVRAWAPPAPPLHVPLPPPRVAVAGPDARPAEDPTPEIRGRILDADGNSVVGATVRLVSAGPQHAVYRAGTTGAGGIFSFAHVGPEPARVVAEHGADGVVTSAVVHASEGQTVELTLVLAVENPFREPGDAQAPVVAAGPVSGEVADDQGDPVAVSVVACEGESTEARTQSGADGAFTLPAAAIGCDVVAEDAEHAPSDPVRVVAEGHPRLRLKPGGGIEGVVVDERGVGQSPAAVGIESFVPARGKAMVRATRKDVDDAWGGFRWDRLAPGSYVLTASVPGRPPGRSSAIEVRGGVVTSRVRVVVPPGGIVVGRVSDGSHAVAGASLRFDFVSSVFDSKASATTDDDGQYRLEGAPSGPFTLRIEKGGFRTKMVSGLRVASGSTLHEDVVLAAGGGWELGGIGAALDRSADGIEVKSLSPKNPAALAGLRAGDKIVRVDGEPIQALSLADVLQRIRGEAGTSVGITAERPDTGETVEVTIVRGTVTN